MRTQTKIVLKKAWFWKGLKNEGFQKKDYFQPLEVYVIICKLGESGFFRLSGIKVLWRLQFLEYFRTLSLKFQKARTKTANRADSGQLQFWSKPSEILNVRSSTPETVAFTIPWYQTWWNPYSTWIYQSQNYQIQNYIKVKRVVVKSRGFFQKVHMHLSFP